jgi:hypothetical protein
MSRLLHILFVNVILLLNIASPVAAQLISLNEPVQVVGSFNGYTTTPYGSDYRTAVYRKISTNTGNPADGRGQWHTTLHAQTSGGDITPVNMTGGSGNGFFFISGPAANRFQHKWTFSSPAQGVLDGINNISCYNCGTDMGLNMGAPGYYTFVFNDGGYTQTNARYYVGYTSRAPVQPTRSSELFNPDGSATITITPSAVPAAQEKIFVRYTTGSDFSGNNTSAVVEATPFAGTYTATIPPHSNGVVMRYYVFSSTLTLARLNTIPEADRSLAALRFDDNSGANYSYTAGVLPVVISLFTGSMADDKIRIRWVAEQEVNMKHYEVYRSNNGVAFTLLKTVTARGNSSTRTEYEIFDGQPNTLGNYYRIICVGRDDKKSVTKIIRVHYYSIDNRLTIYPNPVQDELNVSITGLLKGHYRINIYADNGQVVYTAPYDHNGFDKTLHLVLPQTIKTGPYRLYISNKYEFYKGVFIVQ